MSAWAPGALVGVYVLGERLGAGAMGSVWSARHQTTGAERALKRLTRAGPDLRERFAREGEALGRLQHPNVLRVHERFELEADLVLVTELAQGDLSQRLKRGALPEREAVEVCVALAAGMEAAHEAGVLHRDLKPGNVLFAEDGRPLLADFGLARLEGRASLTETGGIMGTPAYISPEAAEGKRCDERSDVYGLGAILYHCLSGRPPFAEGSPISTLAAVIQRPPEPLEGAAPDIAAACLRALAKDPAERFPSAGAFAEALSSEPEETRPSLAPLAWVTGAACLLLAAVAAVVFAGRPPATPPASPSPLDLIPASKSEESPSPSPSLPPANRPDGTFRVLSRPGELVQAVWQDDARFVVLTDRTLEAYRCSERGVFVVGDPIQRPGHGELQLFHCVEGGVLLGGAMTPLCYVPLDPNKVSPISERSDQVLVSEVVPPAKRRGRIWFGAERKCKAVDLETHKIVAQVSSPFADWSKWRLRALTSLAPDRPVGFYRKNDKTQEAFVVWRVGHREPEIQTQLAVGGRSATYVKEILWVGSTNRGVVPFVDLQPRLPATGLETFKVGRLRAIVATGAGRVFALAETPAKLFEFGPAGGAPIRALWEGKGTQRGWALSLAPDEGHLLLSAHGSPDAPGEIVLVSLR